MPLMVNRLKKYSLIAGLGWLILAQTVRWSHPVITAISWAVFGGVAGWWVWRRRWATLLAVWRSPLLPVAGVAVVSALINGGWWSRVADWTLYAVALAYLVDQRPNADREIVRVGWWVIGISLFEWLGLVMLGGEHGYRVRLLGNPNVIAGMLLVVWPLGLERLTGQRRRWWWWLGLAAMIATGSRGGLLGLALYGVHKLNIKKWVLFVVVIIVLVALIPVRIRSSADRIDMYIQAMYDAVKQPIFGIGPGMYRDYIATRQHVTVGSWWNYNHVVYMHAHNVVLTALAEMGLIGLAGWALAVWQARRWTVRDAARLAALLPVFLVDDMTMYWAVMLGVVYVISQSQEVRT